MSERVLAVIPARGGSKGVPRKNIRDLCGKPVIAWTIETALAAGDDLHRVIVSTDDAEIAEAARAAGAETPFTRPAELAVDTAPGLPVIQHAVAFVEEEERTPMDWVLVLQPSAPFRNADDISESMKLAREGSCDSVISVTRVMAEHPALMKKIENDRLLPYCIEEREGMRRQDYNPPAYIRNGAIYLTRRDVLMENNSVWGEVIRPYVMPEERSYDIDSKRDFRLVEMVMRERLEEAD
jgi:CMP-N-acetylneuraminic acid synthetase